MNTDMDLRKLYWSWFTHRFLVHGEGGGHGVTAAKLRKYEEAILGDDLLWSDVLQRHGLHQYWPWDAVANREMKPFYDHAMGNFWGMVYPLLSTGRQVR